jgi:hypothetical protein
MFVKAFNGLSWKKRADSSENEEKVVNPPRNPVTRNMRRVFESRARSTQPTIKPIRRQPKRFTNKVPHGKLSPNRRPATKELKYRHTEPSPPPNNTRRIFAVDLSLVSSIERRSHQPTSGGSGPRDIYPSTLRRTPSPIMTVHHKDIDVNPKRILSSSGREAGSSPVEGRANLSREADGEGPGLRV